MRKSPIRIKLQYFPSKVGNATYKVVRIEGAAFAWHPSKDAERLHLADALDEDEAEKLSTTYKVTTVL